jgi:biopolymer transport protein ExbB
MNLTNQILLYYAESGGIINALLFLLCSAVVYLGVGKAIQLRRHARAAAVWRTAVKKRLPLARSTGTVYDAMAACGMDGRRIDSASLDHYRNKFREILLEYVPAFERDFDTIAICIAVAPLLGLLGTVAGMMKTFRIIMEFGIGNPGLLSQGISMALVTTQVGLVVAFPCLLFHNYLNNRKEELIKRLLADGEWILSSTTEGHENV